NLTSCFNSPSLLVMPNVMSRTFFDFLSFSGYHTHRPLHSFPTRRSSDLRAQEEDSVHRVRRKGVVKAGSEHLFKKPHRRLALHRDRKSTRLNSSHVKISYAVFCLKKKKDTYTITASYTNKLN